MITSKECDTSKFMVDGEPCAVIHDACAIMWVWLPGLFEGRKLRVDVETGSGICFGSTVVDLFGRSGREPNVFVCEQINDFDKFWNTLFDSIERRAALE
jgi:purine nucleosidase